MYRRREELLAQLSADLSPKVVEALRSCGEWWTDSPLEELMLYALVVSALPSTRVQIAHAKSLIDVRDGNREGLPALRITLQPRILGIRPDFLVQLVSSKKLLVVECDGHDYHERTREQASRDKARDRLLTGKGYTVWRFSGADLEADPLRHGRSILDFLGVKPRRTSAAVVETRFATRPMGPDQIETAFVAFALSKRSLLAQDRWRVAQGIKDAGLRTMLDAIAEGRELEVLNTVAPGVADALAKMASVVPDADYVDVAFTRVCQRLKIRQIDRELTNIARQTAEAVELTEDLRDLLQTRNELLKLKRQVLTEYGTLGGDGAGEGEPGG